MAYRTVTIAAVVSLVFTSAAMAHTEAFSTPLAPEAIGATGTGNATVTFDLDLATMRVQASFSGLSGNTSASHIHGPTAVAFSGNAGVMTQLPSFTGFPLGVQSGSFDQTYDMTQASSFSASFLGNATNQGNTATAFNTILVAHRDGKAYLNIHTSTFGAGEIRGYFRPVPEPTSLAALIGAGLIARRRR